MKISFDDYFKKTNYESIKSLCKNWEQLEIVFFDRKYKIDKDGIWKSCIFQKVNYSPLTKKYRITFNDKTSRKIVYKKYKLQLTQASGKIANFVVNSRLHFARNFIFNRK